MPTYLYECSEHGEFEEIHSIVTKLEFCPQCESDGRKTEVKRLINQGGSGKGIVLLEGQDLVDSVKQQAKQLQKDAQKSERIYSNLLGENKYQNMQQAIDRNKK